MTNIDRVILLLADGIPRTPTQVALALKIPKARVINALADIRNAGRCAGKRQEFVYALTPEGRERVDEMRAEAAVLAEQDEERAAAVEASAKARAAIHAARTGAVPNSVFAWGQGSAA